VEQAVRAGKHVFVEKPLGLTVDEVDAVDRALREAGDPAPVVTVGFNRRFAPLSSWIRAAFADVQVPVAATVRFNAGALPEDHWTQDEGVGGGRIIGEACHGIDLATYLVGSPPVRVFAEAIGGPDAPGVTHDQCLITLRHASGSISSVIYLAGGDKAFPKERVEVIGGGMVGVIDDFKTASLTRGGKTERKRLMGQDKGHRAEIETFARTLRHGGDAPIPWTDIRAVSLAAILAVRSIREGIAFEVPR
jgi:predicted dehydrogenase